MKPLNRPMFRMGGPIKEGIMDGIEEPRIGFQDGTPPGFFGFSFDKPILTGESFKNLFKSPAQVKQQKLSDMFVPDFSMSDYGKVPKLVNPEDQLLVSKTNVKMPDKKMEMVDENVISVDDIDETAGDQDEAFNIPKLSTMDIKQAELASGIFPGPTKTTMDMKQKELESARFDTKKQEADSELLKKLGYDRAVKRGNYQLIEAIRQGLTEGGVQGALDAAFAAGAQDPYGEASKIKQAAALKEYERSLELKDYDKKRKDAIEDYEKKLKIKQKLDPKEFSKSVRTKDYEFARNTLGMSKEDAIDYANKTSTVAENIFKVTSKSQGGFASPNQLADAIRASGEKVDAVFDNSNAATIEAYEAKDGQYVIFDQRIFVGYKDPNSDDVLLKTVR
jgi:hypothetical protein